jgi:hypothetical protein
MTRRSNPWSWTSVRLPETSLEEVLLDLAAPLLARLGAKPTIAEERSALAFAVDFWNASVRASKRWERPRVKERNELKKRMASREEAAVFVMLDERWRRHWLDPRLVAAWTYEENEGGGRRLTCVVGLPDGVRAEIPPPLEKRIAIGGPRFLDEVQIPLGPGHLLSFPVSEHTAVVDEKGTVTVNARMPTVLQLFADGRLPRVGERVDVAIGSHDLRPMTLASVGCGGDRHDIARLTFKPVSE